MPPVLNTISVKKYASSSKYHIGEKMVKSDQFFSGDQYFSPTNNFTQLKLTPTKHFHPLFFVLNKNQITKIFKNIRLIIP